MRMQKNEQKKKDKDNPTKSVCEKNKTRKNFKTNSVFWIKKEQEKDPEKVSMFSSRIFKHVQ